MDAGTYLNGGLCLKLNTTIANHEKATGKKPIKLYVSPIIWWALADMFERNTGLKFEQAADLKSYNGIPVSMRIMGEWDGMMVV